MKKMIIDGREITYEIIRKNVKNINIRVKPDCIVYISANNRVSEKFIKELLVKDKDFIFSSLDKIQSQKSSDESIEEIRFLDRICEARIVDLPDEKAEFENGRLIVKTKAKLPGSEAYIRQLIRTWKFRMCSEYFGRIYTEVYKSFIDHGIDIPVSRITVKDMKTRWGSCNVRNANLSINLRLIEYPEGCIYAVFYHELMHLIHHNHSKEFYRDLTDIFPQYKQFDRILKDK